MGQTLTHGVYLPDEGERNCYAGLAANWQILDTSVGTIAEHTSALSGKAPLVHTHSKSDITDFPAYGNAAGTICEGNDSRLSDARTPVAHTHGKADITDLFNSANEWSALNSYTKGIHILGDRNAFIAPMWEGAASGIAFLVADATKSFVFGQYTTDANNRYIADNTKGRIIIRTGERNNATVVELEPRGTNTSLGSSTNQWKTLNGINPGALSLPNLDSDGYIDLSDNISANTEYSYTPTVDGWLALYCQTTGFHTENAIAILNSGSGSSYRWACSATSGINLARLSRYNGAVVLPVRAGIAYICLIKIDSSTTLAAKYLYFYKATGNV